MAPVWCLILLSVVGAAVAQDGVRSICEHDGCSCQDREGLEHVTCDCGGGGDAQPLLVGDSSKAHVSDRTGSLRVRNCGQVSLVSEALSDASRLSDLELSDIDRLEMQPRCLYRAADGPPRRVTVQRVVDLRIDPLAFRRVKRLQQLEFTDVKGELPLGSFADDAKVDSFRLADSWMGSLRSVLFNVSKADTVTVSNCTFSSLDITAWDVRSATIVDNKFHSLYGMRFNSSKSPEVADAVLVIVRNNIRSLGVNQLKMRLHKLEVINNTFGAWTAPFRGTYHTVEFTGNDFEALGGDVFHKLAPVADQRPPIDSANKNLFTFSQNILRGSYMTGGLYGTFLLPDGYKERGLARFLVSDNRFSCKDCWELSRVVKEAEKVLKDPELGQPTEDGIYGPRAVYGQLYRNSSCLEDGRSLQQYRQDAFTDDLECLPTDAAAAVTRTLTLLLAAAITVGLTG